MTSIDNRLGTNFVQMYIPLADPDSEASSLAKETVENLKQLAAGTSPLEGLRVPTEQRIEANNTAGKLAREGLRQQQKETPVYVVYKLDGEVVGMYLKDATAYTMFDDGQFQAKAISEAKNNGLTFEDLDAYVSGKMEDRFKAEFGDRFEVETFGYSDDAPHARDYSE